MKLREIAFFPNGNMMVFDEAGQQVPEYQGPWLLKCVVPMIQEIDEKTKITLPDGRHAKLFQSENGFNWEIVP